MKNKIYFIEGIPGAGKTTLSKNLYAESIEIVKKIHLI